MTTSIYQKGVSYNTTNAWTPLEDSNLLTGTNGLSSFYTNTAGNDLKSVGLPHEALTYARSIPVADGTFDDSEKVASDYSAAGSGTSVASGVGTVFVLSLSEYNQYNSHIKQITTVGSYWWLRSVAEVKTPAVNVSPSGIAYRNYANVADVGYRPAMWVKS
jgi:hypothetical protein